MAKKEVKTDLWVYVQLNENHINADVQGSDVKEIDKALKTASKRGTGNAGYPEYVAVIDDSVLVIADKADVAQQIKLTDDGVVANVMQQRSKYSYGYRFKEKRMLRQKLMVPLSDTGKPDYAYIEQYAKKMMLREYEQYLDFLKEGDATSGC